MSSEESRHRGRRAGVAIVVVLAPVVAGFFGVRWWTGDGHRDQQFASELGDMPGVTATSRQHHRVHVELDPTASRKDVAAVLRAFEERTSGPDGESGTVSLGGATTNVFEYVDEDWAATILRSVGRADLPHAREIDVPTQRGQPVEVELDHSGAAIDAARTLLREVASHPDALKAGLDLRVTEARHELGSYGVVALEGLRGSQLRSRLHTLDHVTPLTQWHPALTFPRAGPEVSLLLSSAEDAPKAVAQARTLLGAKAHLTYQIGRDGPRIVGGTEPARATRLIDELTSPRTTVTRLHSDLSRIVVDTSYQQLPEVLQTAEDAGVQDIDVRWKHGELDRSVVQARRALPAVRRLRSLGYTTVWVGPSQRGRAQRVAVAPLSREADRQKQTADPSTSTALARAIRSLDWHGSAEVHIAVSTGVDSEGRARLEDHIFSSTATGRATQGPSSHEVDLAVTQTWDRTASKG